MKIKALWGFFGDATKLGAKDNKVRAGQEFSKVDPEYAHALIGKGLAVEVAGKKPAGGKAATPATNKAAEPAENKTADGDAAASEAGE